jgi:hypothetical protein
MVQTISCLGPNLFVALTIGDEGLPESAKMRQKAPTGAGISGGRRSAQNRASRSLAPSPEVPGIRSLPLGMQMETTIRGSGRQLIAWHSSPYSMGSAAGRLLESRLQAESSLQSPPQGGTPTGIAWLQESRQVWANSTVLGLKRRWN